MFLLWFQWWRWGWEGWGWGHGSSMGSKRCHGRAYSRLAPSQWETGLLCNEVSHWLGTSLESALHVIFKLDCFSFRGKHYYSYGNWKQMYMYDTIFVDEICKISEICFTETLFKLWWTKSWPTFTHFGLVIMGHIPGSTLAQVMAGYLMALSHYLNRCWLHRCALAFTWGRFVFFWHLPESDFTRSFHELFPCNMKHEFGNYAFKITTTSPRGQWVGDFFSTWSSEHLLI